MMKKTERWYLGSFKVKESCKHVGMDGSYYGTSDPEQEMDWRYNYCPGCGEKL